MTGRPSQSDRPWSEEVAVDEDLARQTLKSDFPDLHVETICSLGEGWNSRAYLINGEWVFRFPKRKDVEEILSKELKLLPRLSPRLPISIPHFCFAELSPGLFPFAYAGYRKMDGVFAWDLAEDEIDIASVAMSFGELLTCLHNYSSADAASVGCEVAGDRLMDDASNEIRREFELIPDWAERNEFQARMRKYLDSFSPSELGAPTELTVTHGDLLPDHILLSGSRDRVCGIIDWGEAKITDPAADFAGLYYWLGRRFVLDVLKHYRRPADPLLVERSRFMALRVGIGDVWYGLDANIPRYFRVGRACLGHCLPESN
jgi:aminoglycoside phosphotransferase (APT) family kinase protein